VKPRTLCLASSLLLAFVSPAISIALRADDSEHGQRVIAAFVLALGRMPIASEISAVSENTVDSISDLVARLGRQLENDQPQKNVVARRAFLDVFGREPLAGEIDASGESAATYLAASRGHLRQLAQHRAEYEQVLQRAYRRVVRRDPYAEEVAYWIQYDVIPYALLTAGVEHWARRNQPGLMVTSGRPTVSLNSEFLTSVQLSLPLATEAAVALGTPRTRMESDVACATARNVLAVGAESLVSDGGIPFVAAGRPLPSQ
jgi:hypothetical protein